MKLFTVEEGFFLFLSGGGGGVEESEHEFDLHKIRIP